MSKKLISNLILFLFFLLVATAALLSDIFQNPVKTGHQVIEQAKLFNNSELKLITYISLKNKSGEFIFERKNSDDTTSWHMTSPQEISSNSLFIDKLFSSLSTIKVKKIFPDEKINASNFSLDKPTATLILKESSGKEITISTGLLNTIDNSIYLKIQSRVGIYHTEAPTPSLENATLLDLTESQIIAVNFKTISTLKIFHTSKSSPPLLEIKKEKGQWLTNEGVPLLTEKVEDYFQELSNLKSSFLIETQTDGQKKQISSIAHSPDYILSIQDLQGNSIDYIISGPVKGLSDLDLKNEEYFVLTLSSNETAYLVKKDYLEFFNKNIEILKAAAKDPAH